MPIEDFKLGKMFSDRMSFTVLNSVFKTHMGKRKLASIIFEFTGKWPKNTDHDDMSDAASYLIYKYHYESAYNEVIPKNVIERTEEAIKSLGLTEKEPRFMRKREVKRKPRKSKNIGDDVALKLQEMTAEQMLEWEKKLGVDKEILIKHGQLIVKNIGLARMNISNKIRYLIRNQAKTQSSPQKSS